MNGMIFDIQRFCIHDGPGIRTTVFLKGCPLRCLWCHNPESQSSARETMFCKERCVSCGRCQNGMEEYFVCFHGAKEICGYPISADRVLEQLLRDKIFFEHSGGGITLSGGEPLYQLDFSLDLLKKAKESGLHTAVETCGFSSCEALEKTAAYTDLFLFDYKETDPIRHKEYTGVENTVILQNLAFLNGLNKQIILRCPIIKGFNDRDEHWKGIAETANRHRHILQIEIEPYHPLGEGKRIALGKSPRKFALATEEEKKNYLCAIQKQTDKKVILS